MRKSHIRFCIKQADNLVSYVLWTDESSPSIKWFQAMLGLTIFVTSLWLISKSMVNNKYGREIVKKVQTWTILLLEYIWNSPETWTVTLHLCKEVSFENFWSTIEFLLFGTLSWHRRFIHSNKQLMGTLKCYRSDCQNRSPIFESRP